MEILSRSGAQQAVLGGWKPGWGSSGEQESCRGWDWGLILQGLQAMPRRQDFIPSRGEQMKILELREWQDPICIAQLFV